MNIERLQENIDTVFNDYNINILFTTHSMPCKLSMASVGGLTGNYGNDAEQMAAVKQAAQAKYQAQSNETLALQKAILKAATAEQ